MKKVVLYIHGKGGSAAEADHYKELFTSYDVIGLDYKTNTPWETGQEISEAVDKLSDTYEEIVLIANSIGAFFSKNGNIDDKINRAFFISPIVNMEKLITDMMLWSNVTEDELRSKREITTAFGETLSWDYLCYVRKHPVVWNIPTCILYGATDNLTSIDTITEFKNKIGATLTVIDNGEHWFHTDAQMKVLDNWIVNSIR